MRRIVSDFDEDGAGAGYRAAYSHVLPGGSLDLQIECERAEEVVRFAEAVVAVDATEESEINDRDEERLPKVVSILVLRIRISNLGKHYIKSFSESNVRKYAEVVRVERDEFHSASAVARFSPTTTSALAS